MSTIIATLHNFVKYFLCSTKDDVIIVKNRIFARMSSFFTRIRQSYCNKSYALCELEAMNINSSTIFGGLNGCAQEARDFIALKHFLHP